jgi:hypothetical protein
MEEKLAKIRPYYKYELTELYGLSIKTFMKHLIPIESELEEVGYTKNQKIFSLKQTEIIFENFGHPSANSTSGIHVPEKVPLYGYSKKKLSEFYNISDKTLLAQIEALPYEDVKREIMDAGHSLYYERRVDKQHFKRKEVKLIFEWLGHPNQN